MILILAGFVLALIVLWLVVRAVDRQQQKWGGAPKQQPGRSSPMESDTARFSGRSDGGSSL